MPNLLDVLVLFGVMLLALLIGGVILQAACALYHKLAGVPAPLSLPPRRDSRQETGITNEPRRGFAPDDADKPTSEDADRLGGVPKLSLGQTMGIIFLTAIINALVGYLAGKFLGGARLKPGDGPLSISPVAYVVTLPVSVLVIAALLPTSFGKGLLVALLYALICLVLSVVLVVTIVLVVGGLHVLS